VIRMRVGMRARILFAARTVRADVRCCSSAVADRRLARRAGIVARSAHILYNAAVASPVWTPYNTA
jgi:hypothetical protein